MNLDLNKEFEIIFNKKSDNTYFSPGRINLIGEHTDYNGGHVFPCALSFGTYGLISKRNDNLMRVYSMNFKDFGIIEFNLDNMKNEKIHNWANYPKGVIKTLKNHNYKIDFGLDVLFYGNIPNGAGLSSSASIEILMGIILNDVFNLNINRIDLVKMCQEAENKFIGVNCGIMDQFAIGMGKENCAILLDCNTLNYRYSKIKMDGYKIVISNTNKKRKLADSKYNERRSECERALKNLKSKLNINTLGELTEDEFNENINLINNNIDKKRAKHAVYENQRVLKAVKALEESDLKLFGKLMIDSHNSLKYEYEVTGIELDTLVDIALKQEGVIGSRMTGAGFGGCSVSIVKEDKVDDFIKNVGKLYEESIGYSPSFYVANISCGAKKLI